MMSFDRRVEFTSQILARSVKVPNNDLLNWNLQYTPEV